MPDLSPNLLSKIAALPEPAKVYPVHSAKTASASEPKVSVPASQTAKVTEHHATDQYQGAGGYSSSEVSYVESLMGLLPAQKMSEVMLRTGIPMPANLGQDVDTSV